MSVILEAKDLTTLKLKKLIGSLITHEMIASTDDKKKKKDVALKVSNTNVDGDDDDDEEITFLSRKVRTIPHPQEGRYVKGFKE